MSTVERVHYNMMMQKLDDARRECERLREQLAAAEALNAEAANAGPIVDERIKELEAQLAVANARMCEQLPETELEQRAWELFVAAMATEDSDITPEQSFLTSRMWMAYRDEHRKAGGA